MCQLVDEMFPPVGVDEDLADDYSQFIFWRDPVPCMDLPPSTLSPAKNIHA